MDWSVHALTVTSGVPFIKKKPEVVISSSNLPNKGLGFPNINEHKSHLNVTAKYKYDRVLDDINIR